MELPAGHPSRSREGAAPAGLDPKHRKPYGRESRPGDQGLDHTPQDSERLRRGAVALRAPRLAVPRGTRAPHHRRVRRPAQPGGHGSAVPGYPLPDPGDTGHHHRPGSVAGPGAGPADRQPAYHARAPLRGSRPGESDHRDQEPVPGRDRLARAPDAADGQEPPPDRGPDYQLVTSGRRLRRGDRRILHPDGAGSGESVELHRRDLLDHGGDRRPDAAAGEERRSPGSQRRRDLGIDSSR